ncbi:MAG: inorganic phosphate transporter [Bacilli bacterium]|jgi:PiT family inorganic phosphate transporter|nr:inorganic phosphate transporter [Bacilli bacterium]
MFSVILIAVIIFALLFEFINGFHDTANAIATSVYTRALTPTKAIILSAIMNFVGALVSDKVAKTITSGLIGISLDQYVILAALLGAIVWNLITWWKGIPSSSSHALIGSLLGATIVYTMSVQHILWNGVLNKIIIPLITSPFIGLILGYIVMKLIFKLFAKWSHAKANKLFHRLQVLSAALVSYSHGNNDAQKTMGIITLALISGGILAKDADVPIWVKLICGIMMALGTSVGGWKIMKTMGQGVTKLEPSSGFAAQTSSAIVIEAMTHLGAPVSTTHIITTSVMGVGSAKRISGVKWSVAKNIVIAWVITIPITMFLGGIAVKIIELFI